MRFLLIACLAANVQAKACENARVNYQVTCGSPVAPKYRSPSCREAEIFIRQAC